MSPTKNGEVREVVIEIQNNDRIRVNLWRCCTGMAISVGANIELWDCSAKYNDFMRQVVVNVNVPSDIKVL